MAVPATQWPNTLDKSPRTKISTTATTATTGGSILTSMQLGIIVGTIFISHATDKTWNGFFGSAILIVAGLKGLGWL